MKKKSPKVSSRKDVIYNIDDAFYKYYWLIIPIFTLIYFSFSFFSQGFYQDDEVAHYVNMRDFWSDPWIIMSNWGKPGWKILFVIPSLFGVNTVLLINALISGLTSYFSVLLAKQLKMKNVLLAGFFVGFQPLFYQLSFRSYAEIYVGLILVLSLFFYYREQYNLSALFCGLAFMARQETALLAVILAVYFVINKKYISVLFLGVFPVLLNLIGFLYTGDIFWIISEMQGLGELDMGVDRSFFHYFEVYVYIIGPIVFTYFILGLLRPFLTKENKNEFFRQYGLIFIFFFVLFLFQCYLVAKGTNPGSWRYLLQASPFAGIIALMGFNETVKIKTNKLIIPSLLLVFLLSLLFFSKQATGLVLTEDPYYYNIIVVLLILSLGYLLISLTKVPNYKIYTIAIIILTFGFTMFSEKPRKQSPENAAIQQLADWYNKDADKSKNVLYNHQLIIFYGDIFGEQKQKFKIMTRQMIDESPPGTILIWDSHYSYRPEYKNDTQLEYLQNNSSFKPLNQFMSSDKRFASFIFEKL